jgi:hypothetical protein
MHVARRGAGTRPASSSRPGPSPQPLLPPRHANSPKRAGGSRAGHCGGPEVGTSTLGRSPLRHANSPKRAGEGGSDGNSTLHMASTRTCVDKGCIPTPQASQASQEPLGVYAPTVWEGVPKLPKLPKVSAELVSLGGCWPLTAAPSQARKFRGDLGRLGKLGNSRPPPQGHTFLEALGELGSLGKASEHTHTSTHAIRGEPVRRCGAPALPAVRTRTRTHAHAHTHTRTHEHLYAAWNERRTHGVRSGSGDP